MVLISRLIEGAVLPLFRAAFVSSCPIGSLTRVEGGGGVDQTSQQALEAGPSVHSAPQRWRLGHLIQRCGGCWWPFGLFSHHHTGLSFITSIWTVNLVTVSAPLPEVPLHTRLWIWKYLVLNPVFADVFSITWKSFPSHSPYSRLQFILQKASSNTICSGNLFTSVVGIISYSFHHNWRRSCFNPGG